MKISIKTLGCKSNRYESDQIYEKFKDRAEFVDSSEIADVCIVNTCTVTSVADRKSRLAINALLNISPHAKVIVFGCGPRVTRDLYESLGVEFIANEPEQVHKYLENVIDDSPPCFHRVTYGSRTRAVIKIQDGCNNFCAYCIIARARGREISYPVDRILNEAKKKEAQGFREIVLTGINVGKWKSDGMELADLIFKILADTDIPRIRLSSIGPQDINERFLKLLNEPRFCGHLHISLQSGCDTILKRMNRRYDTKLFEKVCDRIREIAPDTAITTDIITGFPGETHSDHRMSMDFARKIGFAKIHVFPFSKRVGTPAYSMDPQVSKDIKKTRADEFKNLGNRLRRDFIKSQIGKTYDVLFEENRNGIYVGWTPNYIRVEVKGDNLANRILPVLLESGNITDQDFS